MFINLSFFDLSFSVSVEKRPVYTHLSFNYFLYLNVGPAALDIAFVGGGQADAWFHVGVHCWDMAAGAVIVTEAGGCVVAPDGSEFDLMSRGGLFASTKELADEVAGALEMFKIEPEYPEPCHSL